PLARSRLPMSWPILRADLLQDQAGRLTIHQSAPAGTGAVSRPAHLPDAVVRACPHLSDVVGEPGQELPQARLDPTTVSVEEPGRVEDLAVNVQLELKGGA